MFEGHRLNPTARFGSRVENYRHFRPGYPEGIIDILAEQIGFTRNWVVADIGSGTGLLTEIFLKYGNKVYGVEPNEQMRRAGEETLHAYTAFHSIDGTAEATTLPGASMDLIVAGQAFHWFEPEATAAEWRRISRGHGWVALIWNDRVVEASGFMREYEALLQREARDYRKIVHRDFEAHLPKSFFHGSIQAFALENKQQLDEEGLTGRIFSSSYMPQAGDAAYDAVRMEIGKLFHAHEQNGMVEMIYQTRLFLGRLRA